MNAQNRLARLTASDIQAATFGEAEAKALRGIHGFLSQLAIRYSVPLHVAHIGITELATGNQRVALMMPYDNVRFTSELNLSPSGDFKFYASLYREALNSNSPAYRFLCFYKIIEALRARRNRLAGIRRLQGEEALRFVEIVPAELSERRAWLTELFGIRSDWGEDDNHSIIPGEASGKKFGRVIDHYLRPLRVGVAHAVLDTGEATLMADDLRHVNGVFRWLGLTQCIARQMLKNDFPEDFGPPAVKLAMEDLR